MAGNGFGYKASAADIPAVAAYLKLHTIDERLNSNWATNASRYMNVGPSVAALLGVPTTNIHGQTASIPLNNFAGLVMMMADPGSGLSTQQRQGVNTLLQQIGSYAGASNAYQHYHANANQPNIIALANAAMGGNNGIFNRSYTDPAATNQQSVKDWATEYAPKATSSAGYGPNGNWTYSQQTNYNGVANFLDYWPQLNSAATQAELTKAISSGWTANQIERALYDPSTDKSGLLKNTAKQFQTAFPALVAAQKSGTPIAAQTPAEYLRLQNAYQSAVQQFGMPPLTTDQIGNMMMNGLTSNDVSTRAQLAIEAYNNADPATKAAIEGRFGLTPAQAATHIMDPTTGLERIKDQINSATLQTRGTPAGLGQVDADKLVSLVDNPFAGVSQEQAAGAVDKANQMAYLQQQSYGTAPNTQTTASSQDVLGAAIPQFGTDQVGAQAKVAQAQQEREQASKAGGQVAANQQGVVGAGQVQ